MINWYIAALEKYATFSGRAQRAEYWYFSLFNGIVIFICVMGAYFAAISGNETILSILIALVNLYNLATFIPALAVGVRRLHDTGRSGWWFFIALIPIVGGIVLLVFLVQDSVENNKYGVNPKKGNDNLKEQGSKTERIFDKNNNVLLNKSTIYFHNSEYAGSELELKKGESLIIGRDPGRSSIVIDYPTVSGEHVKIDVYDNYIILKDLHSTNGTFVDRGDNFEQLPSGGSVEVNSNEQVDIALANENAIRFTLIMS